MFVLPKLVTFYHDTSVLFQNKFSCYLKPGKEKLSMFHKNLICIMFVFVDTVTEGNMCCHWQEPSTVWGGTDDPCILQKISLVATLYKRLSQ